MANFECLACVDSDPAPKYVDRDWVTVSTEVDGLTTQVFSMFDNVTVSFRSNCATYQYLCGNIDGYDCAVHIPTEEHPIMTAYVNIGISSYNDRVDELMDQLPREMTYSGIGELPIGDKRCLLLGWDYGHLHNFYDLRTGECRWLPVDLKEDLKEVIECLKTVIEPTMIAHITEKEET